MIDMDNQSSKRILTGGNMNSPIREDNLVYKEATVATHTIHELLCHVRSQGIDWVPESFGIDSDGKHVLSYIEGLVPHETPDWIWSEKILKDVALKLRQWHDATVNFKYERAQWLLENDEINEVVCHNDFAPYNCVFRDSTLVGIIDFDVCSPGSRIWDLAYTAYRFVPLYPDVNEEEHHEISPFSKKTMIHRLSIFLKEYSCDDKEFLYDEKSIINKVGKRLQALADWSELYGLQTQNEEIKNHARMYSLHAKWLKSLR